MRIKSDVEIAKLIQRLNLNELGYQGMQLLKKIPKYAHSVKKTIDKDFRIQLEAYFDETFISDTKLIKELQRNTLPILKILDIFWKT